MLFALFGIVLRVSTENNQAPSQCYRNIESIFQTFGIRIQYGLISVQPDQPGEVFQNLVSDLQEYEN